MNLPEEKPHSKGHQEYLLPLADRAAAVGTRRPVVFVRASLTQAQMVARSHHDTNLLLSANHTGQANLHLLFLRDVSTAVGALGDRRRGGTAFAEAQVVARFQHDLHFPRGADDARSSDLDIILCAAHRQGENDPLSFSRFRRSHQRRHESSGWKSAVRRPAEIAVSPTRFEGPVADLGLHVGLGIHEGLTPDLYRRETSIEVSSIFA